MNTYVGVLVLDIECLGICQVADISGGLVHPGGSKGQVIIVRGVVVQASSRTVEILFLRRALGKVGSRGVRRRTIIHCHLQIMHRK